MEAFSTDSNRSWVRHLSARASQGRAGGCFWERLSAYFGLVMRDQWEGGDTFVMSAEGLPQTPAPSSGMRRPSRNEEVLTRHQKQSWNVKSSLFPISLTRTPCWLLSQDAECLPLWCLLSGLLEAKSISSSAFGEQWPKVLAYTMISTEPPSLLQCAFLKYVLITCCVFLRWRLSSDWA